MAPAEWPGACYFRALSAFVSQESCPSGYGAALAAPG